MCAAALNLATLALAALLWGHGAAQLGGDQTLSDQGIIRFPSDSIARGGDHTFVHSDLYHNTHQHHHFHHHHHHPGAEDGDLENDSIEDGKTNEIPLDFIQKLNNYTEVNDLLLNFVDDDTGEAVAPLESRFGDGERSAAVMPKPATCMPELRTVKITEDDDPSVVYIPSCTRIERCGGCCSHNLLSCQPTDSESVSFQVIKTQFVGGSKLKYVGKEVILVEKHTKCKCDCKVQEKDCNRFQQYRKSECRCICTNVDDENKCYKENATKLWDPDTCSCQCRNIKQCSTGSVFDSYSCKCISTTMRRRFAEPYKEHSEVNGDSSPVITAYKLKDSEK